MSERECRIYESSSWFKLLKVDDVQKFYQELELVSEVLYNTAEITQIWKVFVDISYNYTGKTQFVRDYSSPE